ncbi:MAG: molybdopterin biosynthesis protein [Halanaerobiales bacterium]
MDKNIYLNKVSLKEAKRNYFKLFKKYQPGTEKVKTELSKGRISASAVYARRTAPGFYASAMDGIAVRAEDTDGASERRPVRLRAGKEAVAVDTGDPIPEGFNAVIMIEDVNKINDDIYEIEKGATTWQHVRNIGESVVSGEMIIPSCHEITEYDIGALLEAGILHIEVFERPSVGIIPTGNELITPEKEPIPGEITEFNSRMLKAALQDLDVEVEVSSIIPDKRQKIEEKLMEMKQRHDITIILAGSSAGEEDYTAGIIDEQGEVIVHGVNIMPGKPVILGRIDDKPVIGLPGYPLSALLTFHLFVIKLIYILQKQTPPSYAEVEAEVRRKVPSKIGLTEFLRVNLMQNEEGKLIAVPRSRGSSAMKSLVRADGIMKIAESREGLASKDRAPVILLTDREKVKNNLFFIGSHDLSLEILLDFLKRNGDNFELKLQSAGSMGGLTSLRRGECHLAGAHLLDPESGKYNEKHVRRIFKNKKMALINLVYRKQGLYVKRGNPKNIESVKDLTGENINFVNRQRGSGTRVLFDYLLSRSDIEPEQISGYERERYTQVDAAAAVARGAADAAPGIKAAAEALGTDFIPIREERYDLILPQSMLEDKRINRIIEIVRYEEFKKEVEDLGGYDTRDSGKIIKLKEEANG